MGSFHSSTRKLSMDLGFEITALTALSAIAFLGGVLLVLFAGPTLTAVGIVLVTVGTLLFVVDVADVMGYWRRVSGE